MRLRRRRMRLRDFSCIPWLPPALGRRTRPFPLMRNRLAAAFFVFIFGMRPPLVLPEQADAGEKAPVRGACPDAGGGEHDGKGQSCQAGGLVGVYRGAWKAVSVSRSTPK